VVGNDKLRGAFEVMSAGWGLGDGENNIFCVLDIGGERIRFAADCAVGWINLRIFFYAPVFGA
jgi:hypothetical protein